MKIYKKDCSNYLEMAVTPTGSKLITKSQSEGNRSFMLHFINKYSVFTWIFKQKNGV